MRRSRSLAATACLGVTASLGLAAPGLTSTPAQATPAEDCAVAFPIDELVAGAAVDGLTVSRGTTPEPFTGEVLGVLDDGIGFGRDMVMVELTSAAIDEAGGIWQGMSGSPVYAEDGRLIGAVAYGLAWGTTPIAGVTPFEYMDDYLAGEPAAAPSKVRVDRASARALAATGEVGRAQASRGFRQLPLPFTVAGVDPDRAATVQDRPYLPDATSFAGATGGTGGAAAADIDTVEAGGNIAALQSVGDVTYSGVGTVTSVCDGRVVGFGHPLGFVGEASYGLAGADALFVQEDPLGVPFKVANVGAVGGTVTDDRLTGIAGEIGPIPPATTFTSDLAYGEKHRVGVTDVFDPQALPSVAFFGAFANHDVVMDSYGEGSELQTLTVEGTDADGEAFTLEHTDRVVSPFGISEEASYPLADLLYALISIEGVEVDAVTNAGEVTDDASTYRVAGVEQRLGKRWVEVGGKKKAVVLAGQTLDLRVTLTSGDSTITLPFSQPIGRGMAGARGQLNVRGGNGYLNVWEAASVEEIAEAIEKDRRNDALVVKGRFYGAKGRGGNGGGVTEGGRRAATPRVNFESDPLDRVVRGSERITVVVKRPGIR